MYNRKLLVNICYDFSAVTCDRPDVSAGVTFSPSRNEYDIGQVVSFKCRRGTTLVGVERVECLNTGEWSEDFPTCRRKLWGGLR